MRRLIAAFQEGLVVLVLIALTGAGAFSLRTLINHESTADTANPPAGSILAEASFPGEEPVILPADPGSEKELVTAPALLPPVDASFLPQTIPVPEPPPSIRLISEATEPEMAETFSTAQQTTVPPLPSGWTLITPYNGHAGDSHQATDSAQAQQAASLFQLPEPFASLPVTRSFSQLEEPQSRGPRFPIDPAVAIAPVHLRAPAFSLPEVLRSAAAAASAALNNTGQTQPSPFYLQDDIQYFPPGHVRMVAGTDEQETKAAAPADSEPSVSNPSIDDPLPLIPPAPAGSPATLGETAPLADDEQFPLPLPAPATPLASGLLDSPDRSHPDDLPRVAEQFQPQRIPEQLPGLEDAAPLADEESPRMQRLRETVRNGLPGASRTERDVWLEELQGLPHEMVKELLQFRRQFGGKVGTRPVIPDFEPRRTADRSVTHTPPAPGNEQIPADQPDEAAPSQAGEPPRTLDPGAEGYIHLPPHTGHAFLPGNGYGPPIMGDPVLSMAESSRILRSQLAPSLASLQLVERVLLNNIANASTPGFRRSRVVLTPMPAEIVRPQASEDDNGPLNPAGVLVGLGVEVAATQIDHTPGEIQTTGRRLDIAIDGEGFLSVITDGEILYTRCGNLTLDNDGCLVLAATQRRYRLEPEIQIPDTAETIRILSDGTVQTTLPGDTPPKAAGQIQLSRFLNPDGLEPQGEGVFAMTRAAGRPQTGNPGTGGRGTLRAGALEQSNVRIEQEQQRIEQIRQQAQLIRSLLGNEGYSPEGPSGVVERTPEPPRVASQPEGYRPYAPMWNPSTSGRTSPGRTPPRNMPLAIPPSYRMPTGNLPYYDPTLQLTPPTGPELPAAPAYDTFHEPQSPAGSPQPQELPLPPDPEEQPIDDSPVTLPLPASLPRILDQPAESR